MKMICGLGNPGQEYEKTRHNVGFMIIDNYLKGEKFSSKFKGLNILKDINGEKIIFLKPQSYMNNSGEVVRLYHDYYKIDPEDILIIRDDLDLPLGKIRIKQNSSSGGHNGIKSVISHLGNQKFYQYKVGISKQKNTEVKNYVLGNFSKEENIILEKIIEDSKNIIDDFIDNRIETTKDYSYEVNK